MNKRQKLDFKAIFQQLEPEKCPKKKITAQELDLDYYRIFSKPLSQQIMQILEDTIEYMDEESSKVKVFGKWHKIPRQQAAYGEKNLNYTFSGATVPAKEWTELLLEMRDFLVGLTGVSFNFVLINKYRTGNDHIGEHRDNEKDLDANAPIASISFGQTRTFCLKHQDLRTKKRHIEKVKIELEDGSILIMNPPTNNYWYHSLPPSKRAPGCRVNLTFRKILR